MFTKIKLEIKSVQNQCELHSVLSTKKNHIRGCIQGIRELLVQQMTRPRSPQCHTRPGFISLMNNEGHGGINDVVLPQFLGSIESEYCSSIRYEIFGNRKRSGPSRPGSASAIILIFLKRRMPFLLHLVLMSNDVYEEG